MAKLNFLGGKFHGAEDDSGAFVPGGKLYFYEPGTADLKDTYATSALATANANPVILDSAGRATIWLNGDYKVRFDDATDNTIYTEDEINPGQAIASGNYNLVTNGSFEDDSNSDGTPDNWDVFVYSPGGTAARVTDDQSHGAASMEFVSTGSGGGYLTTSDFFEVSTLRIIEVSFLIKSSVVDVRNVVTVFWYKADKTASSTASTDTYDNNTTNPTSWASKASTHTPPSDAVYAKLRLYGAHSSDATPGTTWYDDIIVRAQTVEGILTTRGDLLTRDASEVLRLGIGTADQVLITDGTDPSWGASSPLTTRGDIMRRGATKDERVALGTTGQVVSSDGTDAVWSAVDQTIVADSAIGQAELKTATVSLAGAIPGTGGIVYLTLNAYAFWPMIHADIDGFAGNVRAHLTDGAGADNPRFALSDPGSSKIAGSYDVDYRYVQA